jgi:hypothetical protein
MYLRIIVDFSCKVPEVPILLVSSSFTSLFDLALRQGTLGPYMTLRKLIELLLFTIKVSECEPEKDTSKTGKTDCI